MHSTLSPKIVLLLSRQKNWQYRVQWMLFKTMLTDCIIGDDTMECIANCNREKELELSPVVLIVMQAINNMRCLQFVTSYL